MLTCVYCGQEYPEGTPASGAEIKVLTDHIRICTKHPLRDAEEKIKKLRKALIGLVGESEKEQLLKMEAYLRCAPIPDIDKANTINAIWAIIETD